MKMLKTLIPDYINLTAEDCAPSLTRQGEELWEQIVRNIVSHKGADGNIIAEGFAEHLPGELRITDAGRMHLKRIGF